MIHARERCRAPRSLPPKQLLAALDARSRDTDQRSSVSRTVVSVSSGVHGSFRSRRSNRLCAYRMRHRHSSPWRPPSTPITAYSEMTAGDGRIVQRAVTQTGRADAYCALRMSSADRRCQKMPCCRHLRRAVASLDLSQEIQRSAPANCVVGSECC